MAHYTIRPTGVGLIPHGDKYTVKHLGDTMQGYIDLVRRELGVSLNGDLPWTRWVQLHEMSHVRWSRASAPAIAKAAGVEIEDVLAAEDARVNTRLVREVTDAHAGFDWGDQPIRTTLGGYVASMGAPPGIRAYIREEVIEHEGEAKLAELDRVYAECVAGVKLTISGITIQLAKALCKARDGRPDEMTGRCGPTLPPGAYGEREAYGERDGMPAPRPGSADEAAEDERDALLYGDSDYKSDRLPLIGERTASDGLTEWLIPEVVSPPLNIQVKRPGTHEYVPSDGGVTLRDVARIATDGSVFGRTLRRPGTVKRGTVLVDASGSMSIAPDEIEELIAAVPSAVVAVYCAQATWSNDPHSGRACITIVAKDGRRCDPNVGLVGPGNCCDGPALLWLSRMPGPRVWYCDGVTTNRKDYPSGSDECDAIVRAGRVIHVKPAYGLDGQRMRASTRILAVLRERRMVK